MKWPWRQEKPSPEVVELEKGLQETRLLIAQAYAGFNSAVDPELVESYVYEIQALQARYSYLLRQRKEYDAPTSGAQSALRRETAQEVKQRPAEAKAHPVLPVA